MAWPTGAFSIEASAAASFLWRSFSASASFFRCRASSCTSFFASAAAATASFCRFASLIASSVFTMNENGLGSVSSRGLNSSLTSGSTSTFGARSALRQAGSMTES